MASGGQTWREGGRGSRPSAPAALIAGRDRLYRRRSRFRFVRAAEADMPTPEARPRVLVIGDVITDVIVRPEGPIVPGSDRRAKISVHPGGSASNQAAWLAHFGVPVALAARVGQSDLAHQEAQLRAAGVIPLLSGDETLGTGMLVNIIAPDGERSFLTDRGASVTFSANDLPLSLLEGLTLVHVSGYALFAPGPRAAVMSFIAVARSRGITVTVDPASTGFLEEVGPDNFLGWTRDAAILFPNADEARCLSGRSDPAAQIRFLTDRYDLVVVKRGGEGAEAANASVKLRAAPPAVDVVDTTGAGDAFVAAFLAARLAGASLEACLKRGVEAGAEATTRIGGRPHSP